jgi:chromosome segregation ATPase
VTDEIQVRLGRLEERAQGVERRQGEIDNDVRQLRTQVETMRTDHRADLKQTEDRITSHLEKQDEAISKQGTKIDEMHGLELERSARERATLEAEEAAKVAAALRRQRRGDVLKVLGIVIAAPSTLVGLFAAFKALAGPLWKALGHFFAN